MVQREVATLLSTLGAVHRISRPNWHIGQGGREVHEISMVIQKHMAGEYMDRCRKKVGGGLLRGKLSA